MMSPHDQRCLAACIDRFIDASGIRPMTDADLTAAP
jgi:hypothetical protein